MSSVEFLVKLRDAAQMMADAANEYLERLKPPEAKEYDWNPDKIKWTQAEGSKGPYQRSDDVNSPDFKALLKDLETHNGKLTRNGFFYWKFNKSAVVGRKKRKV